MNQKTHIGILTGILLLGSAVVYNNKTNGGLFGFFGKAAETAPAPDTMPQAKPLKEIDLTAPPAATAPVVPPPTQPVTPPQVQPPQTQPNSPCGPEGCPPSRPFRPFRSSEQIYYYPHSGYYVPGCTSDGCWSSGGCRRCF